VPTIDRMYRPVRPPERRRLWFDWRLIAGRSLIALGSIIITYSAVRFLILVTR
jgi:hypothetical protein